MGMHDSDLDGTVAVDEARQLMFMRYGSAFQEKHVDELFEGSQGGGVSLDAFMKFAASQRDAIAKALDIKGGNVLSRGQMRAAQQEKIRKWRNRSGAKHVTHPSGACFRHPIYDG